MARPLPARQTLTLGGEFVNNVEQNQFGAYRQTMRDAPARRWRRASATTELSRTHSHERSRACDTEIFLSGHPDLSVFRWENLPLRPDLSPVIVKSSWSCR
jgi:hypothetical protein